MLRRNFLKMAISSGSLIATSKVEARDNHPPIKNAAGMLFDSTLCIGCQACVVKCQEVNYMEPDVIEQTMYDKDPWEVNEYLSDKTHNVIQVYENGKAEHKNQVEDGFAYVKRQCMHCVDANCVSVCPTSALQKDQQNGVVTYNKDACIGCRYCMVACPFNVPKFEYDDPFGEIHKCQFCNQKGVERLDKGMLPGCVEACPTGAIIYGTREELLAEAKKRLSKAENEPYLFAREKLDAGKEHQMPIPKYEPHVYGEFEGGGTQVLVLSGVPHEKLGLPQLEEKGLGARTETLQHSIYKGLMLPAAALAGLLLISRRNAMKQHNLEQEQAEQEKAKQQAQAGKDTPSQEGSSDE